MSNPIKWKRAAAISYSPAWKNDLDTNERSPDPFPNPEIEAFSDFDDETLPKQLQWGTGKNIGSVSNETFLSNLCRGNQ